MEDSEENIHVVIGAERGKYEASVAVKSVGLENVSYLYT